MDRYTLTSFHQIERLSFLEGAEVTFAEDGVVTINHVPFQGFRDKKGRLHVYEGGGFSKHLQLDVTLNPVGLVGATILAVHGMKEGSQKVVLETDRGAVLMEHERHCCEWVELVDVSGDPSDLLGGVIGVFEVRNGTLDGKDQKSSRKKPTPEERLARRQFTFYEIRTTNRGDVTLRWGQPTSRDDNRYGEEITLTLLEPRS